MNKHEVTQELVGDEKEKHLVTIIIDKEPHKIPRGPHTVSQLKKLGNVPQAYELAEIVNGEIKPLDDNATVEIKGGEKFKSHPKTGGSSH